MGLGKDLVLVLFLCSADPTATLGSLVLRDKFEAAKVPVQVASQLSVRPVFQGAMVTPSDCLPSDLHRPVGFRVEGIWADANDLLMMSLKAACRDWRPALPMQLRPWVACSST